MPAATISSKTDSAAQEALAHALEPRVGIKKNNKSVHARWMGHDELVAKIVFWNELANDTAHRNPCLEPEFLLAALKHLDEKSVRVLVVEYEEAGETKWAGLLPLASTRLFGMPFSAIQVWKHEQCFDSTPLLRKGLEVRAWSAMVKLLKSEQWTFLELDTVAAESKFERILKFTAQHFRTRLFRKQSYSRPAFRPLENADEYRQKFVSSNCRKKMRRYFRKLEQIGEVSFERGIPKGGVQKLANDFLELESSGWKGRNGTALACQSDSKDFFKDLLSNTALSNKFRCLVMKLNGKPIAMIADIQSGPNAYAYKTAFDETYAEYSPGMLIEYQNLDDLHRDGIQFADSCTTPDNQAMGRIWGQQTNFQSLVLSLKPGLAGLLVRSMPWLQKISRIMRNR